VLLLTSARRPAKNGKAAKEPVGPGLIAEKRESWPPSGREKKKVKKLQPRIGAVHSGRGSGDTPTGGVKKEKEVSPYKKTRESLCALTSLSNNKKKEGGIRFRLRSTTCRGEGKEKREDLSPSRCPPRRKKKKRAMALVSPLVGAEKKHGLVPTGSGGGSWSCLSLSLFISSQRKKKKGKGITPFRSFDV